MKLIVDVLVNLAILLLTALFLTIISPLAIVYRFRISEAAAEVDADKVLTTGVEYIVEANLPLKNIRIATLPIYFGAWALFVRVTTLPKAWARYQEWESNLQRRMNWENRTP